MQSQWQEGKEAGRQEWREPGRKRSRKEGGGEIIKYVKETVP